MIGLISLSALVSVTGWCADRRGDAIEAIRQRYGEIESALSRCAKVDRNLEGQSTEGGETTGYFLKTALLKVTAVYYGETGRADEEYYFEGERVIFVLRTVVRYTKPLSGVVATRSEERFYFHNDVLIRWLDSSKHQHVAGDSEAMSRAGEMLSQAKMLADLVRKPAKE